MTLKDLVKLRARLQDVEFHLAQSYISNFFAELNSALDDYSSNEIANMQKEIVELLKKINTCTDGICNKLQDQIDQFDDECHAKSLTIYNNSIKYDGPDYLFEKNQQYFSAASISNKKAFLEKIKTKIDWRFPAMEIRPNNMFITHDLVACDPLYLVDTHKDMFANCETAWNDIYQRRVRYYTVNEQDAEILYRLPNSQFGLIVSADFFDHRPLDLMQRYLREFYTKLRPGGTAIFTFNDCDYPEGVENFENIYYCYTPGHTIIKYCNDLGYIVKQRHRLNGASSYIEIQKPGTLTALRSAQTLGKIINI